MTFKSLFYEAKKLVFSRIFLIAFSSLLVISLSIAYVASEINLPEKFLSLGVLGSNMMTKDYYPNGNSTIFPGETVRWYATVHNHLGSPQYLALRMKLLNSSQFLPDDNSTKPSPVHTVFEIRRMVPHNSTWVIPLNWTLTNIDENYTMIKSININGINITSINTRSLDEKHFMIILELWRYDTKSKNFVFTWPSRTNQRVTWDQLWFSLK